MRRRIISRARTTLRHIARFEINIFRRFTSGIDISGINKVVLLKKLWQNSPVASYYQNHPQASVPTWDRIEAKNAVKSYIDYFRGRLIKSDLASNIVTDTLYDDNNGIGAFQKTVDEINRKSRPEIQIKFEDYSDLQKKYGRPEYSNISCVKYLLRNCDNYQEFSKTIKRVTKLVKELELSKTADTDTLLETLEKEYIIDARSRNIIKELGDIKNNGSLKWLMSLCKIDGIAADCLKAEEIDDILTDPELYLSQFSYCKPHSEWIYCANIKEYKQMIEDNVYNILNTYQPRAGQLNYGIPISIFIGFKLFKPRDVTIKLLVDQITKAIEALNLCKQDINYHSPEVDKYIKIASAIAMQGLDKYIASIKNDMFALMDADTKLVCKDILAVIRKVDGGTAWLIEDGHADSKSPVYTKIRDDPTLKQYLGWPFCTALANLHAAYRHGIIYLQKAFIASHGIAWDSFTLEEAIAMKNEELEAYIRNKKTLDTSVSKI